MSASAMNGRRLHAVCARGARVALILAILAHANARTAAGGTSGSECIRDAAGFSQSTICTANDVRIVEFEVLGTCASSGTHDGQPCVSGDPADPCALEGGTCEAVESCVMGEQVQVPIRAKVIAGAKERYDIGFYISQDGGDAEGNPSTVPHGGVCFRDYLHPASATNADLQLSDGDGPYYNAEIGVTPADTCGDLANNQTVIYDFGTIPIMCRDADGNGILDVGTCLSWDINKMSTCNGEADAVPNSSSKCGCSSIAVGDVTVCGDGRVQGPEQCDEGANNGTTGSCCTTTCQFKTAGTVCRAAADECDAAETCSGTSASCPADAVEPNTTECRPAAGACDVAEFCTGSTAACPADAKSTAVCRPPAGSCDVSESCDGASNDCPADGFKPATIECRTSAGVCDPAEFCTGSDAGCPADAKSTAVCRLAAGACDVPESCDGASNDCPPDAYAPATTVCRTAAGDCDAAEHCTGSATDCPPDAFQPSTTVCRTVAGACDVAEHCTGTDAACPADAKSTAVCRPAAGDCDVAEACDGASNDCPVDGFKAATVECRAAAGACDVAEQCTGSTATCPADAFRAATVECRPSAGICDGAEYCSGNAAACPADAKSTAVCRPAAGDCDVAESCDGVHDDCPADALKPVTAECRPAAGVCDLAEYCTGTDVSCPTDAKSMGVCRAAGVDCEVPTSCDGHSDACPACPQRRVEICGDCIDNDGDGLVDYDDPDCCQQLSALDLKRMRIVRPDVVLRGRKLRLKLRALYAKHVPPGFDPMQQDTTVQVSDSRGPIVCATVTKEHWMKQGHHVGFCDKAGVFAHGLLDGRFITPKPNGKVIFRTISQRLPVRPIVGDQLRVTIRVGDRCTKESALLTSKQQALVFP